jgi:hypothetical protein
MAGRSGIDDTALVRSLRSGRSAITATIRDNTDQLHVSESGGLP